MTLRSVFAAGMLAYMGLGSSAASAPASAPAGRWIGSLTVDSRPLYTKLVIAESGARIHVPQRGIMYYDLSPAPAAPDSFRWAAGDTQVTVRLTRTGASGSMSWGRQTGKLELRPYRALGDEADSLSGAYAMDGGGTVVISRFGDGLQALDLDRGRTQKLWASSLATDTFHVVLPLGQAPSGMASITRTAITLPTRGAARSGRRRELWSEQVIRVGGTGPTITGVLKTPGGSARIPLVVMVPGSGANDRTDQSHVQALLVTNGFAVFAYDKRGVRESGGNHATAEYDSLADDVVRIVESLSSHARIDARQVFLYGHSQGAWLAAIAAAKLPRLAGMILVAGSTETPPKQTIGWIERHLRATGVSEAEIREALEYEQAVFDVVTARGAGWEQLEKRIATARTAAWWGSVTTPGSLEDLLTWPGFFFDPAPVFAEIRVPVLALYGARDVNVAAQLSAQQFQKLQPKSEVRVFEGASHNLAIGPTGDDEIDWPYSDSYAPGFFDAITGWLSKRAGEKR